MAIKEISVTRINKQRRVDCLAAIGPPFFLTKQSPQHSYFSTAQSYTAVYTRLEAAQSEQRRCKDAD